MYKKCIYFYREDKDEEKLEKAVKPLKTSIVYRYIYSLTIQ